MLLYDKERLDVQRGLPVVCRNSAREMKAIVPGLDVSGRYALDGLSSQREVHWT
jgi:hypothetical protein